MPPEQAGQAIQKTAEAAGAVASGAAGAAKGTAGAASGAMGGGGMMTTLFLLLPMFAIMYFMIIRPQQKQQKERQKMIDSLKVGDSVLTTGGLYGTITKMGAKAIKIKLAQNLEVKVDRSGITGKASPGDD